MTKLLATATFAAGLALATIGSAQATAINFSSANNPLGVSQGYGPITAYGFVSTSKSTTGKLLANNLYYKTGGSGETGLGLSMTNDNEINAPAGSQAIVLDVSNLIGQDLSIGFGSVQAGEDWKIGFDSIAGLPTRESAFSNYKTDNTAFPAMVDLGVNSSRFLILEAVSGNVLLTSLSSTAVPEPASMTLVGAGLLGLGYFRRRNSRN